MISSIIATVTIKSSLKTPGKTTHGRLCGVLNVSQDYKITRIHVSNSYGGTGKICQRLCFEQE